MIKNDFYVKIIGINLINKEKSEFEKIYCACFSCVQQLFGKALINTAT